MRKSCSSETCFLKPPAGQKLYAKQTVFDAHLQSKKHLKAAARTEGDNKTSNGDSSRSTRPQSKLYGAARLTALIQPLLVPLLLVLAETKNNVERRFSLTARERELELQAATAPLQPATNPVDGAAVEEEEEEEKIYNPLKLPLGWDGKPIPYWLYKLHGLGVEYRCEICSDGVYMGRFVQSRGCSPINKCSAHFSLQEKLRASFPGKISKPVVKVCVLN